MTTREQMEADRRAQRDEAMATEQAMKGEAEGFVDQPNPADLPDSPNPPVVEAEAAPQGEPSPEPEAPEAVRLSPGDATRRAIADRFKGDRGAQRPVDGEGDLRDQATMYGAHTVPPVAEPQIEQPEPPVAETPVVEPAPLPEKVKLRVRQQDVELTTEEVLAAARKYLAGESYFEDGKTILNEVKAIRDAATRPPQDATNPDPAELDDRNPDTPPQAVDDVEQLVEDIQLGDPKQAAAKLREVFSKIATQVTDETAINRAMAEDIARTRTHVAGFFQDEKNVDLADTISQKALLSMAQDEMAADLKTLGFSVPSSPQELAAAHRLLRVKGVPVRDIPTITEKVATDFRAWKTPTANPQPAVRSTAPQVAVNRDARRATIPVQPSRATASPQPPQPSQPQTGNRSKVVAKMQQARGQMVTAR